MGVKNKKITEDGSGYQILKTLYQAKKMFPGLDPEKDIKQFTKAQPGKLFDVGPEGRTCLRFDTWAAVNSMN
jgi:hypothetical protein